MKYKTAKVVSHPRSGSHYLANLLNINFFHKTDYTRLYGGHNLSWSREINNKNTAVLYTYRNTEDTLRSIYKIRDRFGLDINLYEEFLNTKFSDMYIEGLKCDIINNGTRITKSDSYFSSFKLTPEQYLYNNRLYWSRFLNKENFMIIKYDNLITNFNKSMRDIAKFLGSDKVIFENSPKVGWYLNEDT